MNPVAATSPTRALVTGIVHESSGYMVEFSGPTRLDAFDVHTGAELIGEFAGTNTVVGGYLTACHRLDVEPVAGLHARAEPGAAVLPDAFGELLDAMLDRVRAAGAVDVVLLDLHGAGALTTGESLDLAVVRALRDLLGHEVPIAVTVDLHANLPAELVELVDVLVGFQEYPHTDMAVRAERAAALAVEVSRGGPRPVLRMRTLPLLLPPSTTWSGPGAWLRDQARNVESWPEVLACTALHAYPYADTPQAAAAVVTVATSQGMADRVNRQVADWLWDNRERFRVVPVSPEQAVAAARTARARPVVIGDATDNPGCGAIGDSTYLLHALLGSGLNGCFATIHDPETVRRAVAAGIGATVEVELGGRHGWASGPPVRATARVRTITDGRVVQRTMRAGKSLDFGVSVRLSIGAVDVIVSSQRRQVFDPEIMLLHGAVPERYDVLAVKSVNHFRAGFAEVGELILLADAPGPLTREIDSLPRGPATSGRWPMNPDAAPSVPTEQPSTARSLR